MGISGRNGTCGPRSMGNSGRNMAARMDARHYSQDYDTMQGYDLTQLFFPLTEDRQYINVPLIFGPDQRLDGRLLTCLELVDGSVLPSYRGVDMPLSFKNGWIILKDDCDRVLAEFPMSRANRVLNGGKNYFFRKMPVDWTKSYIQLTSIAGLASAGFLFNVWTVPN